MVRVDPPAMPLGGDYWVGGFDIDALPDIGAPVWGVADMHAHPMSYLGFGGSFIWGAPGGQLADLGWCTPAHGIGGTGLFGTSGNLLMAGVEGGFGHRVGGYPEFDGWPRFTSTIHQQMHVDWIRRAVAGGLRLMVALVVNDRLLAHEFGDHDDGDRLAVEAQISALHAFAAEHSDLMEVVSDSATARTVIQSGRLAVVPGVEVDTLGDWNEGDASDEDFVAYLRHLVEDLGIRHIFPIHLVNNAFGGAAIYMDLFNALNYHLCDDYFAVDDASNQGIDFRLGEDEGLAVKVLRLQGRYTPPKYSEIPGGHANTRGLTPQGEVVLNALMDLGVMIDTDHMSYLSLHEALDLAESRRYPVIAGHTAIQALAWRRDETGQPHKLPNEYMRSDADLGRIHALGGMISIGLHQGDIRGADDRVLYEAAGSSTSWAQAYLYATGITSGAPVGIGTDMDGLAGSAGPRFGLNAAYELASPPLPDDLREPLRPAQVDSQRNGVRYVEPLCDYRHYRFTGVLDGNVYSSEERDIWQALAISASGTPPDEADLPNILVMSASTANKIRNLAKGFSVTAEDQLDGQRGREKHSQQLAAYRTANGQEIQPGDGHEVGRLFRTIGRVWSSWQAMSGNNAPLHRNFAGRRDFDINLDGVAHYGLLPDFLQDLCNIGLTQQQLAPLFGSAEAYLRTWTLSERAALRRD